MPAAQWIQLRESDQLASGGDSSEAARTLAVRLLDLVVRDSAQQPIGRLVGKVLADALEAEHVELVEVGEGWPAAWSWPSDPWPRGADFPAALLHEALDRGAAAMPTGSDPAMLICPLDPELMPNRTVLAVRLRGEFRTQQLALLAAVHSTVAAVLAHTEANWRARRRLQQFEAILDVTRQLALARDTRTLLERIAAESTRLLNADRASIFVWDRPNRQLVARPALGIPGGELRIPDDVGIVGDVLQSGQTAIVNHVREDRRFDPNVDRQLGYETHSMLCAPLVDAGGERVGAFQVLNHKLGGFTDQDSATLELLAAQVAVALQSTRERENLLRISQQVASEASARARIVGGSSNVAALRANIERVATTVLALLILGESGTGKEVVARAVHHGSGRRDGPFVPVNCAAIAETLLESELFGHEKGAFTDAREQRRGKFELASGGTLFLDEIGDMSASGQAKLLRVLEEQVVYRVGGTQPIRTDARIVAASNRDLAASVQAGKFRQDLFFRLSVVTIALLPLRERREDILPLAEHFLAQFSRDARRPLLTISPAARQRLESHDWPGNIRELRNLMERLAFLSSRNTVEPDDLDFILTGSLQAAGWNIPSNIELGDATSQFQQQYIAAAIERSRGNLAEAARLLGMHRSNLYRKMHQLGMETS